MRVGIREREKRMTNWQQKQWGEQVNIFYNHCTYLNLSFNTTKPRLIVLSYRSVGPKGFIYWSDSIICHILHVPLKTLALESFTKSNSITDVARVYISQFWLLVVQPFFVFIHPDFCYPTEVYKSGVSLWVWIWNMMPVNMSDSGTRDVFQLAATLPELENQRRKIHW